ncbi:MAG: lysophospholipid acyltransferase family protein [Xenococcaceae cyanobacterium]
MPKARSKLEFIPPAFNPFWLKIAQWSLPIVQRVRLQPWLPAGISEIETINVKTLVKLYSQFQQGKIRFLMAFRHCEVDDPICGMYLLAKALPSVARQQGIALQLPINTHFMYDRGMPIWAGAWLGKLFSQWGGIPVHRGKPLDLIAIKTAREILLNGKFPLVVAPEGATNGHSEIVSPLEPGVAQLSFWCASDLAKASRNEEVMIVPIGIQYHYVQPQWKKLDWLLSKLEADCGLPRQKRDRSNTNRREDFYYQRLFKLGEYLLTEMEEFYRRFYHRPIPKIALTDPEEKITVRLKALLDIALEVGEEYFALKPKGTVIERCRRLEEAGWTYIYREDIADVNTLSPVHHGLADWVAKEATCRMKHMRLVESLVAVTGNYLKAKPSFDRFAETSLILFDLVARIKGKKMPRRPRLGWRKAQVTVGEAISVSDRYPVYQQSRQAAKQEVAKLTQDLYVALKEMIK